MECPNCSEKLTAAGKFCPSCGARLPEAVGAAGLNYAREVQGAGPDMPQQDEVVNEMNRMEFVPEEPKRIHNEDLKPVHHEKAAYVEHVAEPAPMNVPGTKIKAIAAEPAEVKFWSMPTLIYMTLSVLLILYTCAEVWSS